MLLLLFYVFRIWGKWYFKCEFWVILMNYLLVKVWEEWNKRSKRENLSLLWAVECNYLKQVSEVHLIAYLFSLICKFLRSSMLLSLTSESFPCNLVHVQKMLLVLELVSGLFRFDHFPSLLVRKQQRKAIIRLLIQEFIKGNLVTNAFLSKSPACIYVHPVHSIFNLIIYMQSHILAFLIFNFNIIITFSIFH